MRMVVFLGVRLRTRSGWPDQVQPTVVRLTPIIRPARALGWMKSVSGTAAWSSPSSPSGHGLQAAADHGEIGRFGEAHIEAGTAPADEAAHRLREIVWRDHLDAVEARPRLEHRERAAVAVLGTRDRAVALAVEPEELA